MSIFDVFTGQSVKDAAAKQQAYLTGLQNQISGVYTGAQTGGLEALRAGQATGTDALNQAIAQSRGDIRGSLDPAIAAILQGTRGGETALREGQTGGLSALGGGVTGAVGAYDPLQAAAARYGAYGGGAGDMVRNALGLNGPEGYNAAMQTFKTTPAYQFELGQGIDALTRAANATGMGASGNTLRAAQEYGEGLASKQYPQWLQALTNQQQMYLSPELQALTSGAGGTAQALLTGGTGGANILTGTGARLSDLLSGAGTREAGIQTQAGQSLADISRQGGTSLADLALKSGMSTADLYRLIASGQAGSMQDIGKQYSTSIMDAAKAETAGSANLWNAIGQAAKFAASGGMSGITDSLASLTGPSNNMFSNFAYGTTPVSNPYQNPYWGNPTG